MGAERHYGTTARGFHWLTASLLVVIIPLGLVMGNLPKGDLQNALFTTHESLGLTVLLLTLARFAWRLSHPPPPPFDDLSPLEKLGSGGVHYLLYLVLLAMPLSGFLFVALRGIELDYFGIVRIPPLVAPDKGLAKLAGGTHAALQWAVYSLALLHIGAALHHYFVRRNDVLARMWPSLRRPLG